MDENSNGGKLGEHVAHVSPCLVPRHGSIMNKESSCHRLFVCNILDLGAHVLCDNENGRYPSASLIALHFSVMILELASTWFDLRPFYTVPWHSTCVVLKPCSSLSCCFSDQSRNLALLLAEVGNFPSLNCMVTSFLGYQTKNCKVQPRVIRL